MPSPGTIAVFDIPAVDTLTALGVPIAGTVNKLYVDYLDEVGESAAVVGSLFEPDYKALADLNPDLIVIGGRSSTTYDNISKLAPTIDMTVYGDDLLTQVRQRLQDYGEIFGKQEKAAQLSTELDAALAEAKAATSNKGDSLIIMTNGPKISAFGPGSRFGWVYDALGLQANADDVAIANHGDAISFEFLLEQDPEWLLVLDRSAAIGQESASAQQTLDNEIMHKTTAWKKGQVVYLNSANVYIAGGGITSQLRTLAQITEEFGAAN